VVPLATLLSVERPRQHPCDVALCALALQVCVLQAIPEISITNGVPTTALPLAFVLFFDAIVTAKEDYNRHRCVPG